MGWKGAIRSVQASIRAAEREASRAQREREREETRRQRELARDQKQYERTQELERAAQEVAAYEDRVGRLQSLHKDGFDAVEWSSVAVAAPPEEPSGSREHSVRARKALADYKFGLADKLLGRGDRKRADLEQAVSVAEDQDESDYQQALRQFKQAHSDWEAGREFANRILDGDMQAHLDAIRELDPFSKISDIGSSVTVEMRDPKAIEALLHVHDEQVIPKESKTLLKSGKVSVKKLPVSRFYELYQDYVCSCAFRIARDLFAILPIEKVVVTALDNVLNKQTGHLEEQPVLSVAVLQATLQKLNLDAIDPSDAMNNFVHNMSFKKTRGFAPVDRLTESPND